MRLYDVATLVEAWFAGDCEPLQDRLRGFVSARIAELRIQIAEDSAFKRELERILGRLGDSAKRGERCGPDCGCDTDPLNATGTDVALAGIACSLSEPDMQRRLTEWRRALGAAISTTPTAAGARFVFHPSPMLIAELARLCAAETACCPFFTFGLDITASALVLTVGAHPGMEELVGRLIDTSSPLRADPSPASGGLPGAVASTCACTPAASPSGGTDLSAKPEALAG
jgi:MerR family copper efflux transcriptional regulator